eukprot:gene5503-5909_t
MQPSWNYLFSVLFFVFVSDRAFARGDGVKAAARVADWSPFIQLIEANHNSSKELISQFPIFHYWDLLRGSFRTGIIENRALLELQKQQQEFIEGRSFDDLKASTTSPTSPASYKYQNFTSKIDKRINHRGKHYNVQQDILDTTQVFMHLLVTIQALANEITTLAQKLRISSSSLLDSSLSRQKVQFFHFKADVNPKILEEYAEYLSSSFNVEEASSNSPNPSITWNLQNITSSEKLEMKKQLLVIKSNLLQLLHDYATEQHKYSLDLITTKYQTKKDHLNELTDNINHQLQEFNQSISQKIIKIFQEIEEIIKEQYEKERLYILQSTKSEYETTLSSYEDEIKQKIELITYRFEEEKEFLKMQSEQQQSLTILQSKQLMKKNEIFIQIIFDEFIDKLFHELFHSNSFASSSSSSSSSTSPEIPVTLPPSAFTTKRIIQLFNGGKVDYYKEDSERSYYLNEQYSLIFSPILERQVITVLRDYSLVVDYNYSIRSSSNSLMYYKNYLFYGQAGCGKSITTSAIISYLQRKYSHSLSIIRISGSDLLSLGNLSGNYLKEVMTSYSYYRMPLLLVIDEVDSIIRHRGRNNAPSISEKQREEEENEENVNIEEIGEATATSLIQSQQRKLIQTTLFSLLEGLRQPSSTLSTIFITRLTLTEVDPAILDRIDDVIHFDLPGKLQRLQFILRQIIAQLIDFLPSPDDKSTVHHLLAATISNSSPTENDEVIRSMLSRILLLNRGGGGADTVNSGGSIVGEYDDFSRLQSLFDSSDDAVLIQQWNQSFIPEIDHPSSPPSPARQPQHTSHHMNTPNKLNHHQSLPFTPTIANSGVNPVKLSQSHAKSTSRHPQTENDEDEMRNDRGVVVRTVQSFIANRLDRFSENSFDVEGALKVFLLLSQSWSFRELHKKLMNIRYQVLCSERCLLNSQIWMKEISYDDI